MRLTIALAGALSLAMAASLVNGCGSSSNSNGLNDGGNGGTVGDDGPSFNPDPSDGGDDGGGGHVVSAAHIVPANAKLIVQAGQSAGLAYTVMGTVDGATPEVDVTDRFVFYVPDNYLVGGFPSTGGPLFTSRLPTVATDPPQRGGTLTVQAQALNPGNVPITLTTPLTVELDAQLDESLGVDGGVTDGGVPANASSLFTSGTADPTRAPVLAYPNDGTMLPPNLRLLDIHWQPGSASNTLYKISFVSASAQITYYSRCGTLNGLLSAGSCGFQLDETGYAYLSASNAGAGNVQLTIQGTDDTGTGVGTSKTFNIQFAQETVNGGVYYWDVSHTRIMRFDFGGAADTPDVFLAPGNYGTNGGNCVGCHALSRDGTKIAASALGQNNGLLVYVNDIAALANPGATVTVNEDGANRMQFGSFDPLGDLFVGIYGDGSPLDPQSLYFHDGTTGLIVPGLTKKLAFEPDHPSWSPDGTMIAMTHVGIHGTSQMTFAGGIDVATFGAGAVTDGGVAPGDAGAALADPVVVIPSNFKNSTTAVNSYNPDFAPDSTFMVYTQTTCPAGDVHTDKCDSDISNNNNEPGGTTTTWAVKPVANATPIHLDNAAAPGVADGVGANVLDTFPRATPFETTQGSGRLFWFTVASLRQPGLRLKNYQSSNENSSSQKQQQLWMFAVDPAKIMAGQDGSYTAFFLPFQDPTTSNHIAQWTQQIATSTPAPPPPSPPPPAPPPAPPPPK
ncbi:MAG TPA: hypothetical protein VH044_11305 [Polyangiaceae bacterium]|jgi:hypothetical protein|nr:hypothetical protein [Polyangiaceae bacterium]